MTGCVGLATCAEFPQLEESEQGLVPALAERQVHGVPVVWDDPAVDWTAFDVVVVRSTWDYADRIEEFLGWLDGLPAPVLNTTKAIRWNIDKRYLAELQGAGIAVVPTTYLAPSGRMTLPSDGEFVIKPTVSAGSRDTARYRAGRDDEMAMAHARDLLATGREVMLQPYLDAVDDYGETAMLFINGRFSHAIRKGPLLTSGAAPTTALFAEETITPRVPQARERALADAVARFLSERLGSLLFARIDLLATARGPVVLEAELTEPSLFLDTADGATERLADAIAKRLNS